MALITGKYLLIANVWAMVISSGPFLITKYGSCPNGALPLCLCSGHSSLDNLQSSKFCSATASMRRMT